MGESKRFGVGNSGTGEGNRTRSALDALTLLTDWRLLRTKRDSITEFVRLVSRDPDFYQSTRYHLNIETS